MRTHRRRLLSGRGAAAVAATVAAGALVAFNATASSATSAHAAASVIKIGLITDETGALAPDFVDVPQDFMARIAYQNSLGGVNHHKLQGIVVDDQSSPTGNLAAARKLVQSDHVAVVAEESGGGEPGSAAYLHGIGMPVVGGNYSGPDWNTYKNMFADLGRAYAPAQAFTTQGLIFKALGATSVCSDGYGVIPSSHQGTLNAATSVAAVGLKSALTDTSVTPGGATTVQALAIKNAGCDGLYAPLGTAAEATLYAEAVQDGAPLKYADIEGGAYGVLGTPTAQTLQNSAFTLYFMPGNWPSALAKKTNRLIKKYGGAGGRPNYDFDGFGWLSADLAIAGLKATKGNTSHAKLVKAFSNLKGYTAGGLLPATASWSTDVVPADLSTKGCMFSEQLVGSAFKPMNGGKPICGKPIS